MSKTNQRKRSKKYNPNKLSAAQVQQNQKLAEMRKEASQVYEFSMSFVSKDVRDFIECKKIEQAEIFNRFPNAETIPYHITIGAYNFQELAIALVLEHLNAPDQWDIELAITMSDREGEYKGLINVNLPFTVPKMTHLELWKGKKDCYIELGNGLKKKGWRGLDTEIVKELEKTKEIPDGFGIDLIEVRISASASFRSVNCYKEFLAVAEWVNTGVAENKLSKLWIADQVIGHAQSIGLEGAA